MLYMLTNSHAYRKFTSHLWQNAHYKAELQIKNFLFVF